MQTYLRDYNLYSFDWERVSKTRNMAENSLVSPKHPKHDKSNVEDGGNALAKR